MTVGLQVLRLTFPDGSALLAAYEGDLKHGRAFVAAAQGVSALDDCALVIVRPGDDAELEVQAQAVFIKEGEAPGIGIQLRPFDAQIAELVRAFVHAPPKPRAPSADEVCAAPATLEPEAEPEAASEETTDCTETQTDLDTSEANATEQNDAPSHAADETRPSDVQAQPSRIERLRKLTQTEQQKVARSGSLNDRMLLERLYGRYVWETLLHNPKITVPEVAVIARKGSVPRPLLEFIVENATWISAPVVRRALLGNPRISSDAILKLLRLTPKHELKTIHKTTTYSAQIRDAARRLLEHA